MVVVGVAEWIRHLVVAQKTVGSNPTAHPVSVIENSHRLGGGCFACTHDLSRVSLGQPLVQMLGDKGIVIQVRIEGIDAIDLPHLPR